MICSKCGDPIEQGDERSFGGRILCEDCYMDALSPARTCDPWAVHSAKSIPATAADGPGLTADQQRILEVLRETGGLARETLAERLRMKPSDLERDLAALRHMEKVRGRIEADGGRVVTLW